MIKRESTKTGDVKVTFIVAKDGLAGPLAVVGDFNAWDPTATPLRPRRDWWTASVLLTPGTRYAFRYLTEAGAWFNDDAADDYQPNGYGGSDSIVDLAAGA